MLSQLAIVGATLIAVANPAAASVKYDPATKTGFVGKSDVREAFGWTGAVLASRASGLVFDHDFWTDDTYSVTCGKKREFPVVHHRDFGRFELADAVTYDVGYSGKLIGFRLTGARFGISGTSVPPAAGQPCPQGQRSTIDKVRLVSSTTGWTLTVRSGDQSRTLAKW
jgi:hypothetical protein